MGEHHELDEQSVEAVLAGRAPSEAPDLEPLAHMVRELRAEFADGPAPAIGDGLAAFMAAPEVDLVLDEVDEVDEADEVGEARALRQVLRERRRRWAAGAGGFAATVTGKVVLGGAVAAASVGGLHAAEVIDVPVLPDRGGQPAAEVSDDETPGTEPGGVEPAGGGVESKPDTPPEPSNQPDDAGDFGSQVSDDASDPDDPGVDGREVSDDARERGPDTAQEKTEGTPGAEHIPDEAPGNAPDDPAASPNGQGEGPPEDSPAPEGAGSKRSD